MNVTFEQVLSGLALSVIKQERLWITMVNTMLDWRVYCNSLKQWGSWICNLLRMMPVYCERDPQNREQCGMRKVETKNLHIM